MRKLAKTFKALSDTNRIRILKMLEVRPLCVCEISAVLGLANSTVSKHLSKLRDADFIIDEKEGKWVNYYLSEFPGNLYVAKILPLIADWIPDDLQLINDRIRIRAINRVDICKS